jgi:hypothetical protein
MSWGIECTGTKEGVKERVIAYLDAIAPNYAGQDEGADIEAAKARILAFIDKLEMSETFNGVSLKASGSHSWTSGAYYTASVTLNVQRVSLALGSPSGD